MAVVEELMPHLKSAPGIMVAGSALALPILLPYLQFGLIYRLWAHHGVNVTRDHCSNSCWDTNFKAGYETGAGIYKHVYFNTTWQAGAMWSLTLVYVAALYECVKYLATLRARGRLRARFAALFLASVYPHYYAWWTVWNYLNDDFYEQMWHQALFTGTELLSTAVTLQLADADTAATPARLLVIVAIAAGHVAAAGWDQFVTNVLLYEGFLHQILRDVGFMVPDLLNIYLPIQELKVHAKRRRVPASYLVTNNMALATLATAFSIWFISAIVL